MMISLTKDTFQLIRVFEPKLSYSDKYSVIKAVVNNQISGTTENVQIFEYKLAELFDRKFAIALTNGTTALEMALRTLDLKKNDEVVVPSFTIISCLSAIVRSGAKPVFCDVDKDSWNMTLDDVKRVVTPNTKALIMVHTYGLPADAKNIKEFCQKEGIKIIEDTAEAHGQYESGIKCGSFGLLSTLSFYANKHITTGEGGAILTDSEELYLKLKKMVNLDFGKINRFNHSNLYWNHRLGGLQAALGIAQINGVNKTIKNKQKQAKIYDKAFSGSENLFSIPQKSYGSTENHYWVYGIVLKKDNERDKLMSYLEKENIQTRAFFWPLHLQDAIKDYSLNTKELKNSEHIGKNGLYLPIGKHMSLKKQRYVISKILKFYGF